MNWGTQALILLSALSGVIAYIPATIAKEKGYRFLTWWLYSWLLPYVAIIHVAAIPNKNIQLTSNQENIIVIDAATKTPEIRSTQYRLLATLCFALLAAYFIYCYLEYGIGNFSIAGNLYPVMYAGITLALLKGNKKVIIFFSSLFALYLSYCWIPDFLSEVVQKEHSFPLLHAGDMVDVLAYVALIATLITAAKRERCVQHLYFLPATFRLLYLLINIYVFNYFFPLQFLMEKQWLLSDTLREAIEACGFAFAGLWLKSSIIPTVNPETVPSTDGSEVTTLVSKDGGCK